MVEFTQRQSVHVSDSSLVRIALFLVQTSCIKCRFRVSFSNWRKLPCVLFLVQVITHQLQFQNLLQRLEKASMCLVACPDRPASTPSRCFPRSSCIKCRFRVFFNNSFSFPLLIMLQSGLGVHSMLEFPAGSMCKLFQQTMAAVDPHFCHSSKTIMASTGPE